MEISDSNTRSKSGDVLTEKYSLRKSIFEFIEATQCKGGVIDEDWITLLNFIVKAMQICPDVFVISSRCATSPTESVQNHAFLLWVIQNLLSVLTQATSVHLQISISNCLQAIFNLTRSRSHPVFCYLLREAVHMVSDLSDLYQMSTTPSIPTLVNFPVYLSHYQSKPVKLSELHTEELVKDSPENAILPLLVEIHNITHLGSLLDYMLMTLNVFCDDVSMFYPGACNIMYQIAYSTLKYGDLSIKLAALTMIESLMKGCEFASTSLMDSVLWSLVSTVTFFTRLLLQQESISVEFQDKLSSCLQICFCPSEGKPYAVVRFWDYLISAILTVLSHQSYPLCSTTFKVCVGELLHKCSLMKTLPPSFKIEIIVDCIGKVLNIQPLVPTFYQLLQSELSNIKIEYELGSKEELEKADITLKGKKPLGNFMYKKLFCLAQDTQGICSKDQFQFSDFNNLLCLLEGIRAILDVYARLLTILMGFFDVWLSSTNLTLLCNCWESSLSAVLSSEDLDERKRNILQVLPIILDSIGALSVLQGVVEFPQNLIEVYLKMVMIPWPLKMVSNLLESAHTQSFDRFQETLFGVPQHVDTKLSRESSLWAIVALKDIAEAEKLQCLSYAMDDNSSLLETLINCLPLLFTSSLVNDAILSILHGLKLPNQNTSLQCLYIKKIPDILISLSGHGFRRSSISESYCLPVHQSFEFDVSSHGCRIEGSLFNLVLQPILEVSHPICVTELIKCFSRLNSLFELADCSRLEQMCLDFFNCNDPSVQTVVSSHVIQLLLTEKDCYLQMSEIDTLPVVLKLKEMYQLGVRTNDTRLQEFSVVGFGQICRFSKDNLFVSCLEALLRFYLEPSIAIKAVAYVQLQKLTTSLKLSASSKLLSRWKEPICEFLVSFIHKKKLFSCTRSNKSDFFNQVSTAFEVDPKKFFEITRDILIPLLICHASTEASGAINLLADLLDTSTRSLIMDSFKYVFLYLIQRGSQQDFKIASDYLKCEADFEMVDLLRSDTKNVLNQLLLQLSLSQDRVLTGVRMLAELEPHENNSLSLIDFIQQHLLGVIAFFKSTLLRSDRCENISRGLLALESLIKIMEFLGPKYITDVKIKVITMLRHCLTFKDDTLITATLKAWNCFIRCVELDSLGPLLGQIVVALSPFVGEYPESVSEIFNFLIVENRTLLSSYFNEIYLMPETNELAEVNSVLKNHSETPKSLHEQLRHVLKGVAHERSDVTRDALKKLYSLLRNNKSELQKYMVGNDTADPIVTEIVITILRSLRGADVELRELYGKCLGELGAIDPGKLDIPIAPTSKVVKFYEINADFIVDLLCELERAYLAASNTRSQDCCAYAIQEILKLFNCKNTDPDSEGAQVWSLLTAECQEVLRPHLHSSYSASIPNFVSCNHPIFNLTKKMNFHQWLQKWCLYLIHKLDVGIPKHIFIPCSLIFQHDKSIAQYLLPYILTCLLSNVHGRVAQQVLGEVMAVLKTCGQNRGTLTDHADFTNMCAQTMFTTLDHLYAWISGKNKSAAVRKAKGLPVKEGVEEVQNITAFLQKIPKEVLAHAAFRCQAYTRSLLYFESYLTADGTSVEENLGFLQRVYLALGDSDGVTGAAVLRRSDPSINELTLQYESTGNYRDAGACYERAIQMNQNDISNHEGLLRCMISQGEFTSALMHVDGLQTNKPIWMQRLNTYRVEAAWNLGQWDVLENHLKAETPGTKNWNVNLGRLLLTAKQKNWKLFLSRLSKVRKEQMGPLCTASLEQGSYQRAYEYIVRLHMLQELEEGVLQFSVNKHEGSPNKETTFLKDWEARFQLVQESFRTQEPILSLRRIILGIESSNDKEVGKSWLRSAKIARRDGHLQTALSFLLNARDYSLPEYCMEWAEYKKHQLSSYEALQSLQKAVNEQWPESGTPVGHHPCSDTQAEALLLIGRWMEDTAHYDTQTVLKQYKNVTSVQPDSEDGHFFLGKYYDRLMMILASDRPTKSGEFLQFIVRHYGHTLQYGSKYIYQCMPRMLTLWLDFGSNLPDSGKKSQERSTLKITLSQLNELIKISLEQLPPYQFLIAFSQLISRVCHPNADVFAHIEAIVLKLLKHYPQQALWMMIAVSKSTHSDRRSRCEKILTKAKQEVPNIIKLIDDIVKLSDKLLDVCNKQVDQAKSYSMDKLCRNLPRLLCSGFSSIMVPLQSSMTVTLPGSYGESYDHNPFPGIQPSIVKFDDRVEVLASLQRPKKITVIGSDGNSYILLFKPKDDLRKDARLMEFNTLVNKCLRKDQNSRQRRLHIRTYAVIPLNEECGLLEWVPNTHGLRNILCKLYQEKGCYMSGRDLKDIYKMAGKDLTSKREIFLTKLLPRQPAVFGDWFLRTFPDPTAWYSSRQAYGHTAAVMSIVGYILGLGDRHGENILFDSTNGDCVHVDFNCLFNRGETFDVPEVVPFRLTHNMIHGMGVAGYEGMFRKSCEATMKVLRQECDPLMCVLKTFIHDPLVEWEKVKGQSSSEVANDKPMKIIHDIEDRLNGKYLKSKGLPLSVEGQVHALIKEATDINNLCRMYVGWAPFM